MKQKEEKISQIKYEIELRKSLEEHERLAKSQQLKKKSQKGCPMTPTKLRNFEQAMEAKREKALDLKMAAQEREAQELTFHPKLNKSTDHLLGSMQSMNFYERQKFLEFQKQQKLEKIAEEQDKRMAEQPLTSFEKDRQRKEMAFKARNSTYKESNKSSERVIGSSKKLSYLKELLLKEEEQLAENQKRASRLDMNFPSDVSLLDQMIGHSGKIVESKIQFDSQLTFRKNISTSESPLDRSHSKSMEKGYVTPKLAPVTLGVDDSQEKAFLLKKPSKKEEIKFSMAKLLSRL